MKNNKPGTRSKSKSIRSRLAEFLRLNRDHQSRLLDYFRKKPDIREELIESFYQGTAPPDLAPTRAEMVAVLVLLVSAQPIDRVLKKVERFSLEGWADFFDDEFFSLLEAENGSLRRAGFFREARSLVKVGAAAARMHNKNEWAERLDKITSRELGKQIADQPYRKQSGW